MTSTNSQDIFCKTKTKLKSCDNILGYSLSVNITNVLSACVFCLMCLIEWCSVEWKYPGLVHHLQNWTALWLMVSDNYWVHAQINDTIGISPPTTLILISGWYCIINHGCNIITMCLKSSQLVGRGLSYGGFALYFNNHQVSNFFITNFIPFSL